MRHKCGAIRGAALFAVALALAAAGCGGDDDDTSPTTTASETSDSETAGPTTPVSDKVISAARDEGSVVLYTNADDEQIAPLAEAFEAAFPDIQLETLSLDAEEVAQRYLNEAATNSQTADVLMNTNAISWQELIDAGEIADYEDPNLPDLPEFAKLGPGVTAMSVEPSVAVFNKALLPENEQPTSLSDLAAMADELDGKLGTTPITKPVQLEMTAPYIDRDGEAAWRALEQLGPASAVEASNGPLVTKLAQGQYAAAFFVTGSVRALIDQNEDAAKIVDWTYLSDSTVTVPRAVAVTAQAKSPNAAKVFVNWLLSVEGQTAACEGGFTPYREGVDCPYGLDSVEKALGQGNVIQGLSGSELESQRPEITSRWNAAFGR